MKKRLLKTLSFICLALLSLNMQACGSRKENDGMEILHLGTMYSTDIIPLAVMTADKLDQKYGFTLDMQVFSSSTERDAALQAGELDGVFTDYIGMCIYENAGLSVKITGVTDGNYELLAGPESGISTLTQARGHTAAISENTLIEYALDYILNENGHAPGYLKKVIVPRIPERLLMLQSGEVDLCLLPEPFSTLAIEEGAVSLGSANDCGLYPAVSAFTSSSLDQKKAAIHNFYLAYGEAADILNEGSYEEYEDQIMNAAGYPDNLSGRIRLPLFRASCLPDTVDLKNAIEWSAGKQLCEPSLNPITLFFVEPE